MEVRLSLTTIRSRAVLPLSLRAARLVPRSLGVMLCLRAAPARALAPSLPAAGRRRTPMAAKLLFLEARRPVAALLSIIPGPPFTRRVALWNFWTATQLPVLRLSSIMALPWPDRPAELRHFLPGTRAIAP